MKCQPIEKPTYQVHNEVPRQDGNLKPIPFASMYSSGAMALFRCCNFFVFFSSSFSGRLVLGSESPRTKVTRISFLSLPSLMPLLTWWFLPVRLVGDPAGTGRCSWASHYLITHNVVSGRHNGAHNCGARLYCEALISRGGGRVSCTRV